VPGCTFAREDYEEVRNHLHGLGRIPRRDVEFDLGGGKRYAVSYPAVPETPKRIAGFTMKTGEAFSGPPLAEVAHVDLLMGLKNGPVDRAVRKALARPADRSKPRLISERPKLLLVPTVTIRTAKQEKHLFGEAKAGVIDAVNDSVKAGELPERILDDIVIIANVFVHPGASIRFRIRFNNYKAMRAAIRRALESRPTLDELRADSEAFRHPFRYSP
jgi:5,6,7,8-tetrahydromethanopterin hydro-lyase